MFYSFQVGLEPTRDRPNCLVGSRNSHYAIGTLDEGIITLCSLFK